MAEELFAYYNTSFNDYIGIPTWNLLGGMFETSTAEGQKFHSETTRTFTKVKLYLKKIVGESIGETIHVVLYKYNGATWDEIEDIGTFNVSDLITEYVWYTFTSSLQPVLEVGVNYIIACAASTRKDAAGDYCCWAGHNTGTGVNTGMRETLGANDDSYSYPNSFDWENADTGYILGIEVYGESTASEPPQIIDQSEDQSLNPGDTLELFVTVTGTEPMSYQWSKAYEGGGEIEGATESTYTKENITGEDGGGYYCTVTNEFGTTKSSTIDIDIYPKITDQSDDQTACVGQEVDLFVTATGYPTPTYQWYKNDVLLSGETSSTLLFYASTTATYKCKVSNIVGDVWSDPIIVTVVANPYTYNLFDLQLDLDRTD